MIFTGRMVYLTAVTLQDYSKVLSRELLRLGLMHFVDIRTIDPVFTDESAISVQREEAIARKNVLTSARKRIETILNVGGVPRPSVGDDKGTDVPTDKNELDRMAESFESRIDKIRESQRNLQQQINRLEDVRRHMDDTEGGRFLDTGGISKGGAFLHVHTGSVPLDRLESLEQKIALYPAVLSRVGESGQRCFTVIVGMKRNKSDLEKLLKDHDFSPQDIPEASTGETTRDLDAKLSRMKEEQREYAKSVTELVGNNRTELEHAWKSLRIQELQRTIESRFAETKRAVVASGWLPESTRKDVQTALVRVTEGHISLEWHKAEEFLNRKENHDEAPRITIPSRLANPNLLNPFQRLVTNYGIPAYGTVDPTILVAIAYLAMFGLMFGDAGHGLVLILTGLAGQAWTRKRKGLPMPSGGMASSIPFLSRLMLWCGLAAVVAGVLFGSYFGMSLLPSIWFNYHGVVAGHVEAGSVQSIFDILRITIFFGITVIGLGLLINWLNLVRQKRWFSLFFDNSGIIGGIIYAAGIIISYKFASSGFKYLPDNPILYWIIIACAMILFLKAPLKERGGNPLWWLMEWMISLLEIFSGYLANTLSFMRVAGLGIAHVTLMIAFFQIAKMASPEGFNVWAILIMILGNALVIALEGLSAGIQSLRLNYYEFFSKYFQPYGVEYKPISLEEK